MPTRFVSRSRVRMPMRAFGLAVLLAPLLAAVAAAPVAAQLRGSGVPYVAPRQWWITGGITGLGSAFVNDGPSGGRWRFEGDPAWIARGTIERANGPTGSFGVTGHYGTAEGRWRPLTDATPAPDGLSDAAAACYAAGGCTADVTNWDLAFVLRGGGGTANDGLYQVIELEAGVQGWRTVRVAADGTSLVTEDLVDPVVSAGYGLGYALTHTLHVQFVQGFGLAWHRNTDLPDGVRRTYELRSTRVTVRWGLGTRR